MNFRRTHTAFPFRYFFCGFILLALTGELAAQSAANYSVTRTTGITYNSIQSTGTSVTSWRRSSGGFIEDDNRSFPQPIGFDFWYLGNRYTTFSISTNGFIDFSSSTDDGGPTADDYGYSNTAFSSSSVNNGTWLALAPFYDDQTTQGGSDPLGYSIKYQVTGTAPNRVLTIEWIDMAVYLNSAPSLNYQVKLYELTGVIEFVYGDMTLGTGWTPSYTIGINSSPISNPPTAAQLLTQQVANTANFSNTAQNNLSTLPASYTKLTFTPPTPATPTGLNFTGVTESSMTLNWTDNATNEVGYVIYASIDGSVFNFETQLAANSNTYPVGNLIAGTTYYWRVFAVTEGDLGTVLAGSQTTSLPSTYTSAASGNWNTGSTWVGGVVPPAGANVLILDGHTVTVNTSITVTDLTVGEGTSGILQIGNDATARSVTFNGNVEVKTGATLRVNPASNTSSHVVTFKGNIINNGTFDLAPDGDSRASSEFSRPGSSQTVTGSGSTTNFYMMTVNVGDSPNNILEVFSDNFTVAATNFLTLTNGTLKLSTAATVTPFTGATTIGTSSGLWVNHASASVTSGGSVTVGGLLRLSAGALTIGDAADENLISNGGEVIVNGGTLSIAGRYVPVNSVTISNFRITGGAVIVPAVGSTSTTTPTFGITTPGSIFEWTDGTIVMQRAGASNQGYTNTGAATYIVSGGTLQIGDATTPAAQTININSNIPVFNLTVASANATANLVTNNLSVTEDVRIQSGGLSANALTMNVGGSWIRSGGTFTPGTSTVVFESSSDDTVSSAGGETFYNLTVNKSAGMLYLESGVAVNNAYSLSAGTAAVQTQTLTLNGSVTGGGTLTSDVTGTVSYNQSSTPQSVISADYGNLTFSNFGKNFSSQTIKVRGTFTPGSGTGHTNTGSTWEFNGSAQNVPAFTYNDLVVSTGGPKSATGAVVVQGTLTINSGITLDAGANTVTMNGNVVNNGSFTGTGAGSATLSGSASGHTLSGTGTYQNITLNDANGATLSGNLTVTATLTLTSGVLATGTDTVFATSTLATAVTRTSGHVNGWLRMEIPTGATTRTFHIGGSGATEYTPFTIAFASVTTGGKLTARTVSSEHPQIGTSSFDVTDNVNRYWTLKNNAVVFTTYDITFTFLNPADLDRTGTESTFQVQRYDGSVWTQYTAGTRTTTTTQATGISDLGSAFDFAAGNTTAANAFRSKQSGNWNVAANWERFNGTDWVNAATSPASGTAGVITVRSSHTITVTANLSIDQTVVESGATLAISTGTIVLTVANGAGTDLTVNGTLRSSSSSNMTTTGTVVVNAGGVYEHNRNGGTVPTATWDAASTVSILGMTTTIPSGLTQAFGNFEWNCASQTSAAALAGNPATVNGDFRILNTGSTEVRFYAGQTTTKNIAGSLDIQGGTLVIKTGTGGVIVNVGQDLKVSGSANLTFTTSRAVTLNVSGGALFSTSGTINMTGSGFAGTLNVAGNFSHTSGTLTETGTSSGAINFNGSGQIQSFTGGGTFANTINFAVASGAWLNLGTGTLGGGGTFTLNSGATLGIGSAAGITSSGATGNVQVTGARTFNTGANYIYNGAGAQSTGNGLPATVNRLTVEKSSGTATLTSGTTVSDSLNLISGTLDVGNQTLILNGTVFASTGTLTSGASGTVNYNQSSAGQNVLAADYANLTFSNFGKEFGGKTIGVSATFTAGSGTGHTYSGSTFNFNGATQSIPAFTYYNLTVGAAGVKTVAGSVTIENDLTISAGTLDDGATTVLVKGNITNNGAHTGSGRLLLQNTTAGHVLAGTGSYSNVELDNVDYGASSTDDIVINGTLTLTKGIISMPDDTLIVSASGSVSRPVTGGHVNGWMRKTIAVSGTPQNYRLEVGNSSAYTPIDLTFISVSTSGTVTGRTIDGDHPDLKYSGIDQNKSANRYWTLLGNGIVFSTYDVTLNFEAGDLDAGANTAYFYVRRNTNGIWAGIVTQTRTSTSTKTTGQTVFGDYAVGELSGIFYWTGNAGTSNWTDGDNWSQFDVPVASSVVVVDLPDTVDINTAAEAMDLTLDHDSALVVVPEANSLTLGDSLILINGTLNVETASFPTVPNVSIDGGTVGYTRTTSTQTVRALTYNGLTISGGGTKTADGAVTVLDTLKILTPATFADGGFTITANKHIVVSGTHTGAGKIQLSGGTEAHNITGGGSVANLELNDSFGATVSGTITTVTGALTFTQGILTLTGETDTLAVTGTVTRTSGHVAGGVLKKSVAAGAAYRQFEIGTATAYLPLRVSFANVTNSGALSVAIRAGHHPNTSDASKKVDSLENVNRHWLTAALDGLAFAGGYSVTLSFENPADLDAGVDPSASNFIGAIWNGSVWTEASVALRDADSTRLTGLSFFGGFSLGNALARLYLSIATGNWDNAAVWSPSGVPGSLDSVVVQNTHTVTLTGNQEVYKLTLDNGGALNTSTYVLNVLGPIELNGSLSGSGTIDWSSTSLDSLSGTGSSAAGVMVQVASTKKVVSAASVTLGKVYVLAGDTLLNNGTVTVDSVLLADGQSVWKNEINSVLRISGAVTSAGVLDAEANPNTVEYSGTSAQTIKQTTYHHLTCSGAGVKTAAANITANGALTLSSGSSLTINNGVTVRAVGGFTTAGLLTNNGSLLLE